MTVHVDPLMPCLQTPRWRWRESCHMFVSPGSSIDALHRFARRLGLRRQWFQDSGDLPHYDLNRPMRARAVAAGAVEVDLRAAVETMRAWRAAKARILELADLEACAREAGDGGAACA